MLETSTVYDTLQVRSGIIKKWVNKHCDILESV